jgi:hypothetical protein
MIMGRDVPHGSFGKKVLNHQIFIVICLFIYLSAICGEKAPAHCAVFNWMHSFNSGQETAQMAVHE